MFAVSSGSYAYAPSYAPYDIYYVLYLGLCSSCVDRGLWVVSVGTSTYLLTDINSNPRTDQPEKYHTETW